MSATDLDGIAIGSIVWSATRGVVEGVRHGGIVTDFGMDEADGAPWLEILVEVPPADVNVCVYYGRAAKPKNPHVAELARLDLADVDATSIEPPKPSRMEGWAKKALLGAVVLPGHPFELVVAAGVLFEESKQHYPSRAAS